MDREKVIKGVECCLTLDSPCGDCPYYSYEDIQELDCERKLRHDAIALLKQEAVKPYIAGSGESFETAETWWYECGNCNKPIDPNDKFCRHCGRSVKWE